jgi:hypothetical protein
MKLSWLRITELSSRTRPPSGLPLIDTPAHWAGDRTRDPKKAAVLQTADFELHDLF